MPTGTRPTSPFLHYRWQYTNSLSILHRLSGIALTMGFILLITGLVAIASGASSYARVVRLAASAPAKLFLLSILAAFGYHLSNGIRHLAWDAGFGFDRTVARRTGWLVVATALALGVCAILVLGPLRHEP
ncbi:MAG: succinate dehydrogenase, cytochrome b556 subunit [Steroidobacteraceae bacterium]